MRRRGSKAASILLSASIALAVSPGCGALAAAIPDAAPDFNVNALGIDEPRSLQLEVIINGASTGLIAAFRQDADGTLWIDAEELRGAGIEPAPQALGADRLIDVARLPDVSFEYDEGSQAIRFVVAGYALAPRTINASDAIQPKPGAAPASSRGVLVNYTLFGATGGDDPDDLLAFEGVSGWIEARAFSPWGVLTSSFIASSSPNDLYGSTRLDTTWSFSNPATLITYSAGDFISGGLIWTRPVRFGGIQIRRNFELRPDLVTIPLPELSGSAAVPSTVDVYVNNARLLSEQAPAGPFQITNLPVVTGAGTARLVVRDALGRETVSETPFYASPDMLASGLWDFSTEAGFARTSYGTQSDEYDSRVMASGTVRYGLNDRLTLEAHAEGGGGLANGGAGTLFALGPYGVGSIAGSASSFNGRTGYQVAASVQLQLGDFDLYARTQHTFGDYDDIAGITAEPAAALVGNPAISTAAPPRALEQVSVSAPLSFDPTTLSLSYTHLETADGERSRILGFSLDRPIGKATLFATAFADLEDSDSFGLFAGLSIPLGGDIYGSASTSADADEVVATADLVKSESAAIGSVGWRVRESEGAHTDRAAALSYRGASGRLEAAVEQFDRQYRATAQLDGSVVIADGGIFLANRIDDAFAVVETGAPGVNVQYENRPVGRTDRSGKLLLPNLRSYQLNLVTIDPTDLPVDAEVGATRAVAAPGDRSGTVVRFAVETSARSALVTLRDQSGEFLEAGSSGQLDGAANTFPVGYDGQAFVSGLASHNRVVVDQPTRGRCAAEFDFMPSRGEQVSVPGAVCHPIE
jgi:outer membrane usher protein